MWIYVIINAEIPNIITEKCILQDFTLKGPPTLNDFILILFIQAVEYFKKETIGNNNKFSNITPIFIQTKTIIPDTTPQDAFNNRSQSMATVSSKSTNISNRDRDDSGIFNTVSSTIKGIFKKD